jgi:hypothetical protein
MGPSTGLSPEVSGDLDWLPDGGQGLRVETRSQQSVLANRGIEENVSTDEAWIPSTQYGAFLSG